MDAPSINLQSSAPAAGWSRRLLILSLIGILFLTLFPFRFTRHAGLPPNRSAFLLNGWEKGAGAFDVFLNVLLFVPFGFAVAEKLRERGQSWHATLAWGITSGGLLSYGLEFLQLYIPVRDSGWQDVVTNTAGCAAGVVLFDVYGGTVLRALSGGEAAIEKVLQRPRGYLAILAYFGLWFAISIPLQLQTRLSNWSPDSLLAVGNDIPARSYTAWKGQLFRLQIWDRPVSADLARRLASGGTPADERGLRADYDFSNPAQLADRTRFLPDLSWRAGTAPHGDPPYLALDGTSWLLSKEPVSNLVAALRKTSQFAIRVVCKPAETGGADGRIVGIWKRSGALELRIRQEGENLIFFFRNPLSVEGADLVWRFPGIFEAGQMRDLLFSYDGDSAYFYLDGKRVNRSYHLGPGVALTHAVLSVNSEELDGYNDVYYFLIFFPGGILLGITARILGRRANPAAAPLAGLGFFLVPPLLLEILLVSVSGRAPSLAYPVISIVVAVAGRFWIDADRPASI